MNKYLVVFSFSMLWVVSEMISDIGHEREAYIIEWYHPVIFVVSMCFTFYLGYKLRQTESNERNDK